VSTERVFSIGALTAAAGVSRRTVHFYVQRELLPPPEGLGRGAQYSEAHLTRLLQIKAWQEEGALLHEIRDRVAPAVPPAAVPAPEPQPEEEKRDTWWAAWDESPAAERAPALRYVPGQTWLRQPLTMGYELHVPADRTPLSSVQLAELAQRLFELLESGQTR
jgi:DNA-binding transcriptional MerR regulator